MATITIKTRNHGDATFFVRDSATDADSGYVYLESKGKTGTLGKQICAGGDFSGSTLTATVETLGKVARAWHRQHLAAIVEYDLPYGN
jgi:hypothetical protein